MRLSHLAAISAAFVCGHIPLAAAEDTQHLVPGDAAATATTEAVTSPAPSVETGSIEHPEASIPPPANADIGAAARVLLEPEPSPTSALDAAVPAKPSPEEKDRAALRDFYAGRHDEPLWVTKSGWTPKALLAIAGFAHAGEWGLDPKAYAVPKLVAATGGGPELPRDDLAKADMELSLAVLKYARHARGGLIPEPSKQLSSYLDRKPQLRDRKTVLDEIAKFDDPAAYLTDLQPKHPQFEKLRQAWLEARRAAQGRIIKLPAGPDLKPGDRDPQIALLRKRMGLEAPSAADETFYDSALAGAVKAWQSSKGMSTADGILTNATRAELAHTQKANADQLLANMQEWRWMPEDLGSFYVWVNIPEFLIRVVKNDEIVFTERITAGLVAKQTPIFSDQMERITFKSLWKVPDSIKVNEVWPSLMRGGGLMRQHNLRIERDGKDVDWHKINWSTANMKDYNVYQPPGGGNVLGLVKFSFPSKHYVYMHDTPDKYMFNWTRRANSHGCMRVRNPLDMATLILHEDKGWNRAKIDDLVRIGPDHNIIELDKKVPVHITYFTVRADKTGKIDTWGDIYGHETRIKQALAGKWDKIAIGRDHLAPVDQESAPRVAAKSANRRTAASVPANQNFLDSFLGGF